MSAIEILKLTKKFRDLVAVDSLEMEIEEGELFALLGVNGAGKTTAIKMLTTLLAPTSGTAKILGKDILSEADEVKKLVAVSPQETAVAPNLTVEENLRLMAGVHGFDKEKSAQKTEELLKAFSLTPIRKKRAKTLSGGWQRRLSIAMALISEPKVLFLDEPTLGLDVVARRELWQAIRALHGKVTIVLTTHYLEEAEALSDRLCIMKNGKVLALGTSSEICESAGTEKFEDAFLALVSEGGEAK